MTAPLRQQSELIGLLNARRIEVRPFTPAQIKLLETFADQAVIAIENVRLFQELKESLEQQTATSEILGVIASSPTDIQPVLDTIAQNAGRVCGASDSSVFMLVDGDQLRKVAGYGTAPGSPVGFHAPLDRGSVTGRAIVDRQTIHVHDFREVAADYPTNRASQYGHRTLLAMPLIREGVALGVIGIRRMEVRPFTEKQIALLKTFADQAVIAIENVRLFKELQERNAELREALEHQTATSEVLGIISRSPTDVQPVLDAIVESAAKVCGIDDVVLRLREGNSLVSRAHFGPIPIPDRVEIGIDEPQYRWMREHGTLHVPDVRAAERFPSRSAGGWRTVLTAPLRQQGELVGTLNARRTEVRPFTPAQIKLLETFADQAVIAIENVRLFNELKEALEQQTATSEILGVIASSPTDIQPVFQTILDNAVRLCEAQNGAVFRFDGEAFRAVVWKNVSEELEVYIQNTPIWPGRESALRRVGLEKRPVHIPDMLADPECVVPEPYRKEGMRSNLAVPLLKDGNLTGAIAIHRHEVRPFTEAQIRLLETFAAQAVIAIENVRLFQELDQRTNELTRSVGGELKALGEVGQAVSSTLDLETVLATHCVARSPAFGEPMRVDLRVRRGRRKNLILGRSHRMEPRLSRRSVQRRFISGKGPLGKRHPPERRWRSQTSRDERNTSTLRVRPLLRRLGYRSLLAVPLLREQQIMGG